MAWKYIVVENKIGSTSFMVPVIFPDKLVYLEVYARLRCVMPAWKHNGVNAVSAGKIEHVHVNGLGGDSKTLNLKSRPELDAHTIHAYSYIHGIV